MTCKGAKMAWFAVSCISIIVNKDKSFQEYYPVDEEILLFEADTNEELNNKLNNYINDWYKGDITETMYNGKKAVQKYLGIRTIKPLTSNILDSYCKTNLPQDDTEVMSFIYKLNSSKDMKKLADGKAVDITILAQKNNRMSVVKNGKLK